MLDIFGALATGTEMLVNADRNSCWIFLLDIFGTLMTGTETVCWIFLVRWRLGQKQCVGDRFAYAGDWNRNSLLDTGDWDRNSLLDIFVTLQVRAGDWDRNSLLDIFGTLVTGTETVGYFWHAGDWDRNSLWTDTGDWDRNSLLDIFGTLVTGTETVCWIFLVRWRLGQKQFVGYFWYAGDWDRNSLLDIFWYAGDWDRNSLLNIFGTLVTGTETVCWIFLVRW